MLNQPPVTSTDQQTTKPSSTRLAILCNTIEQDVLEQVARGIIDDANRDPQSLINVFDTNDNGE